MDDLRDTDQDAGWLGRLPVAACAIDRHFRLSGLNAAASELLRRPRPAPLQVSFVDCVHPFDRASTEADLKAAFEESGPAVVSCRVGVERFWSLIDLHLGEASRDGSRYAVLMPKRLSAPTLNHAGAGQASDGGNVDDRAEEWRRFAYTVAHDLKVPLVTMESNLLLMQQDLQTGRNSTLKEDLTAVGGAVQKMKRLVVELLELARIGRLDLLSAAHSRPMEEIELNALVDSVAQEIRAGNPAWGGVIERIDSLPTITGRRTQITEVFQNLIDNAVKYSASVDSPRVEIGWRPLPDGVVLFVRDNGCGIPRQDRTRVFDLFVQLRPDAVGVGVGLPIVRTIVHSHGGRVWVEDGIDGRGASICLVLHSTKPLP